MTEPRPRGRPTALAGPATSDELVLEAALEAFAEQGYTAMSVRELSRNLGVSHNLIPQRYGSKENLWYAAVDHGFARLLVDITGGEAGESDAAAAPGQELVALRTWVLRFVEANAARPALLRIINMEAVTGGARLDHLFDQYIEPVRQFGQEQLDQLHRDGAIRTSSVGLLYFLMTNGAGGAITFPGLAERLGAGIDPDDPDAVHRYAVDVVDVLFEGLEER